MVAASARRFAPQARPRVAVAGDGTLAAIHEPSRVVIVEIPSCAPFSELGLDAGIDSDIAWVGTPPRLIVIARRGEQTLAHLVDPFGPRTIAELQFDSAMKLCAAVGTHALVLGAKQGAAVLSASDTSLALHWFPARALPAAAGAAGAQLVVALGPAIEEWDPQTRLPKRRIKLPKPAQVIAIGGNDRSLWLTTHDAPARIDVIPIVERGQPKLHELPEPIATATSHPQSDLVICIGAASGRIWVADLAGKNPLRLLRPDGLDRTEAVALVHGASGAVLAAQAGHPLAFVSLDSPPATPRTRTIDRVKTEGMRDGPVPVTLGAPVPARPMPGSLWSSAPASWRDEIAAWARTATGAPPRSPPIEAIAARHELSDSVHAAIVLLYGSHLLGSDGAAPVDIARVASWPEALGRGELVRIAYYADSRVRLGTAVTRALDELAPTTGTLVGTPGKLSLPGPRAIASSEETAAIAEACLASLGGAILAGYDDVDPWELVREGCAYAATPMLRVRGDVDPVLLEQPLIFVVDDEAAADALGVPPLGE